MKEMLRHVLCHVRHREQTNGHKQKRTLNASIQFSQGNWPGASRFTVLVTVNIYIEGTALCGVGVSSSSSSSSTTGGLAGIGVWFRGGAGSVCQATR